MKAPKPKYAEENIRVTKRFNFEMAHALLNYEGPCKNIHGHSYVLEITILGKPILSKSHPNDGLVIDFTDIKNIVQKEIIDHVDHALVINNQSPEKITKHLFKQYEKVITVPYQPTCENLLIDFKNRLVPLFKGNHKLAAVKLKETKSSWAEWRLNDNRV